VRRLRAFETLRCSIRRRHPVWTGSRAVFVDGDPTTYRLEEYARHLQVCTRE